LAKYGQYIKNKFKVIFPPDREDSGYWVECPELSGCSSLGDSVEETLDMIRDAIKVISKLRRS
jgi:predicted RNase H-like HicB family nuclease